MAPKSSPLFANPSLLLVKSLNSISQYPRFYLPRQPAPIQNLLSLASDLPNVLFSFGFHLLGNPAKRLNVCVKLLGVSPKCLKASFFILLALLPNYEKWF